MLHQHKLVPQVYLAKMGCCRRCGQRVCGCSDTPYTTATIPLDFSYCPQVPACSEYTYTGCILYNGPELPALGILPGMTLNEVIQRQIIYSVNPTCVDPDYPCQAVTNLQVLATSGSSVSLIWTPVQSDNSYILYYKVTGTGFYSSIYLPSSATNSYILSGLLAGTNYDIYLAADCSPGTCLSVVIRVSTN